MIGICLIGTIIGFAITCIAFVINKDSNDNIMFLAGLILTVMFSAGIGYIMSQDDGLTTKYVITPKVHVICDNGKCDTTYIYKCKTK